MLKLKSLFKNLKNIQSFTKDEKKMEEAFKNQITYKNSLIFFAISNVGALIYIMIKYNQNNPDLSLTRYISRKTGSIGNITIPKSMRKYVYEYYIKLYSVNKEEILDQNLENYTNIKEFFTRKIDLTRRPIENKSNEVLSSPCDGRILSISQIENFNEMIVVKNVKYSLTDFLFGRFLDNYPNLVNNIYDEKKKFYQITIYLSPGDCHRYYSPSNVNINHRIYLPGFLEPVRPNYLQKHPNALATNERVTLNCTKDDSNDTLFITYVGALNVGSIVLNFDDFLKTNQNLTKEEKQNLGFYVLKYSDIISPGTKKLDRKSLIFYKPKAPLFYQELEKDSEEFDIRDMLDIDVDIVKKYKIDLEDVKIPFHKLKEKLIYEALFKDKENIEYNYGNSFKSVDLNMYKMKKKLSNPKEMAIENYRVSDKGIHLEKGDEMGWFNFGSTIVLVFSVDKEKNIKFNFNNGDVVKIGQSLYDIEDMKNEVRM